MYPKNRDSWAPPGCGGNQWCALAEEGEGNIVLHMSSRFWRSLSDEHYSLSVLSLQRSTWNEGGIDTIHKIDRNDSDVCPD